MDRHIPRQSPSASEEGGPLHVNELYNRLLEGGFKFTGQNPTISVAVSLNRNTRFRKVAPAPSTSSCATPPRLPDLHG
jgi:hypothetical protein